MNQLNESIAPTKIDNTVSNSVKANYKHAFVSFGRKLIERRYSASTIETYTYMFRQFLKSQYPKPMHLITIGVIQEYHIELIRTRKISLSYQNQSINAIKFYMEQVLG